MVREMKSAASPLSLPFRSYIFLDQPLSLCLVLLLSTPSRILSQYRIQFRVPFLPTRTDHSESKAPSPRVRSPTPPLPQVDSENEDDDDDSDVESPVATQSPEAREAERLRVLEAAGLLRRRSSRATPKRRRRPPPPRPQRRYRESTNLEEAIAAPLEVADQEEEVPENEEEQEERMEDAYDVSLIYSPPTE